MSLPNDDVTQGLAADAGSVLPKLYEDTVQPASREIGSALARAVRIALAPVRAVAWTWEHAEAWLQDAVEARFQRRAVAASDVVTPAPQLAAVIVRGVQAAGPEQDPTLRDLFANLLAAGMDASRRTSVHPAYAEILAQLTSDEARLLQLIAAHRAGPTVVSARIDLVTGAFGRTVQEVESGESTLAPCVGNESMLEVYLDNLKRLGIVERQIKTVELPHMVLRRESGIGGLLNDLAASEELESYETRLFEYLSTYDAIGIRNACKMVESLAAGMSPSPGGKRVRVSADLLYPTSFGEQ